MSSRLIRLASLARMCAAALGVVVALSAFPMSEVAAAPPPSSQTSSGGSADEAKARFDRGVELYNEGNYGAALVEFRRAYDIAPNYRVLYNIGKVHYQLQNYADAMRFLERYLNEGGNHVPDKRRREVQKEIDRLKGRVAKVSVETDVEGAEITVDDEVVGTTPLHDPVIVSAGRRRIGATAKGHTPTTKSIDVAGGDETKVTLELAAAPALLTATSAPPPPPPPTPPEHKKSGLPPGVWLAWAGAGVLSVAAVVTGIVALGAASDRESKKETFPVSQDDITSANNKAVAFGITTDVLAGAALVVGGVALYMTVTHPSNTEARGQGVRVGVGPRGVALGGAF